MPPPTSDQEWSLQLLQCRVITSMEEGEERSEVHIIFNVHITCMHIHLYLENLQL